MRGVSGTQTATLDLCLITRGVLTGLKLTIVILARNPSTPIARNTTYSKQGEIKCHKSHFDSDTCFKAIDFTTPFRYERLAVVSCRSIFSVFSISFRAHRQSSYNAGACRVRSRYFIRRHGRPTVLNVKNLEFRVLKILNYAKFEVVFTSTSWPRNGFRTDRSVVLVLPPERM